MKKRYGRISLLTAALLLGLCGCQQEEEVGTGKVAATEEPTALWEGKWTAEIGDGKNIPVEMKCEIGTSDNPPDSIVDTQPMVLDSKCKEQMAKAVFGDEVYLYDWENMCEADLQKRLTREENILKWQLQELEGLQEKPTKAGNDYRRDTKKELKGRVSKVKELLKNAPKEPVEAQDGAYEGDSYMGYMDGTAYRLEFNRDYTDKRYDFYDGMMYEWDTSKLARTIELLSVDVEDFAPKEIADSQNITNGDFARGDLSFNECSLSEEEAQKKAEDMLQKLGFNNMVATGVEGLAWKDIYTSYKREGLADGYIFYFQSGVEGNPLQVLEYEDLLYGMEKAVVEVNDKGIVKVRIDAPIQVDSITPDVELLGMEDVKDMLQTQLPAYIQAYMEAYEEYTEEKPSVNNFRGTYLQLLYGRINDPGNPEHFTYVPVWELTGYFDRVDMVKFYVNGIDGSYITLEY